MENATTNYTTTNNNIYPKGFPHEVSHTYFEQNKRLEHGNLQNITVFVHPFWTSHHRV